MLSSHAFVSRSSALSVLAASLGCLLLAGCHVTTNDNGNKKNVDIGTPFGSMKVNTDNSGDTSAIGITAYPGAVPVNDDDGKDANNADVNLSFGDFHLGVKAASFQTSDASDKVIAFYRKDLSRYGDILECDNDKPVGQPTRTAQGLTCDSTKGSLSDGKEFKPGVHFNVRKNDKLELRAGSQQHQHIVGVEDHDGGTKIGLVLLDLPSHFTDHKGKSEEEE